MPPLSRRAAADFTCCSRQRKNSSWVSRSSRSPSSSRPGSTSSAIRPRSSRTAVRSATVPATCSATKANVPNGSSSLNSCWKSVSRFLAASCSSTVLSPSKVVNTSVSAFSAANRFVFR